MVRPATEPVAGVASRTISVARVAEKSRLAGVGQKNKLQPLLQPTGDTLCVSTYTVPLPLLLRTAGASVQAWPACKQIERGKASSSSAIFVDK
jgi:hypothetical protein